MACEPDPIVLVPDYENDRLLSPWGPIQYLSFDEQSNLENPVPIALFAHDVLQFGEKITSHGGHGWSVGYHCYTRDGDVYLRIDAANGSWTWRIEPRRAVYSDKPWNTIPYLSVGRWPD
jgi:hypothetical protein